MKKSVFILTIVLVLTFMFTMTASATQPTEISGYIDNFVPGPPTTFCFHTGEIYGEPDGFMDFCMFQPDKPGLGEHGIATGTLDGKSGTCEYNVRSSDLDGISRFTVNRCTGDLAGLHTRGVGLITGFWEGSYHFHP